MFGFRRKNKKPQDFSKEVAHIELGPQDKKPPKELPVLKIILSVFAFLLIGGALIVAVYLIFLQNRFLDEKKDAKTVIEARLKAYPNPQSNICGDDVKICGSGIVAEKSGISCEFDTCPEFSNDMTRFWKVKASNQKDSRTYTNIDLEYEFDLLKTWDFIGKDYGFILYSPNYECGKEVQSSSGSVCDGTIIEILTSNTTAFDDIEDWYESDKNHILINSDNPPPESYELTEIAEQKAIEVQNSSYTYSYYFIKDNFVYALRSTSAGELDFNLALPFISQILTSFRFYNS